MILWDRIQTKEAMTLEDSTKKIDFDVFVSHMIKCTSNFFFFKKKIHLSQMIHSFNYSIKEVSIVASIELLNCELGRW